MPIKNNIRLYKTSNERINQEEPTFCVGYILDLYSLLNWVGNRKCNTIKLYSKETIIQIYSIDNDMDNLDNELTSVEQSTICGTKYYYTKSKNFLRLGLHEFLNPLQCTQFIVYFKHFAYYS